ncbi:FecR domain-containing protein [Pseudoxanthomonas mexicana]|uniref:FecR domain-containing protein n=1 Tax=Pseudoxanthomonas mexicana TaxID=128785 RepID=UPI00289C4839|nr:FecR domain-containing protein [Pseudoxanthomonas mexicana]
MPAIRGKVWWRWGLAWLLTVSSTVQAQDWAYRVRPGDTLWDVAGAHLKPSIPWQRLQDHNRIANPYQLPPGSTLQIPLAWLDRQPARAKVVAVRGNATSRSAAGRDAPVTAGMSLGSGAVLKTSPDASLSLEFADGSRLLLLGDSELLLDRLTRFGRSGMADTRLRLQRGRIGNEVRRLRGPAANFVVDTPSASSAVRGTQFRVEAREGRTHAEVLEGRVAVNARNQRGTVLRHGFGAVVVPGQAAIAPVALLPAPTCRASRRSRRASARSSHGPRSRVRTAIGYRSVTTTASTACGSTWRSRRRARSCRRWTRAATPSACGRSTRTAWKAAMP